MKITFLAICCFAVVLSTYAAPQSSDPKTGNQNPSKDAHKDPSKSSQNNPSKGSQNNGDKGKKQGNGTKGQQTNGTKGQQGTNNKSNGQNKKGSKKVGNSQLPPSGNNGQNYKQDNIDIQKAFNGKASRGAFNKK